MKNSVKYKKRISSIFLCAYLAFVITNAIHFHAYSFFEDPFKDIAIDENTIESLATYAFFENTGDLVLFGNVINDKVCAFEDHKGTHGGFYGEMMRPFFITNQPELINETNKKRPMKELFEIIRKMKHS